MNDLVESPFAGRAVTTSETAGARQNQARELADLQVAYTMARHFPRDVVKAMDAILLAFTSPRLAERAQYQFARGGTDIRGPSIQAMEAIATAWGNIDMTWRVISRGVDARGVGYSEIEARAIDTQTGARKSIAFPVSHWRDTRQGGYELKDERDVYELCANMAQRRLRKCLEAVIPADVVDSAMDQSDATLKAKADTSAEAMAKMLEAFAPFGITKEHIEKRIQRRLDAITAAQVVSLKRIYASLRDGMSDASEWFDVNGRDATEGATQPVEGDAHAGSGTAAVKSRMKAGSKKKEKPPRAEDTDGTRVVSYAEVADALNDATSIEAVDEAADLIKHVQDEHQRDELEALYRARAGEFEE
ncbi:hypothetical protein [Paraburkholderia sp. J67]|uniref:hypothetical protein n=1 Tax=Paraburkholderia sp. J67 TaxID=2805435 RepID=UPI002ABD9310|nr:hypothetical protein [Paraburkholderia sp. J67]